MTILWIGFLRVGVGDKLGALTLPGRVLPHD